MRFPSNPTNPTVITKTLTKVFNEIPGWNGENGIYRLGFAMTKPHPISLKVLQQFQKKNNNNVGVHSMSQLRTLSGTRALENDIIKALGDLLNDKDIDGYITSGGTEGNITGIWIGRNKLSGKSQKICLIISELTHHSLIKAANLLNIDHFVLPVGKNYGLEIDTIKNTVDKLHSKGYDGFIFCFTAGYYSSGSCDDIEEISKNIDPIFANKKLNYYVHVDACFGGFVYPFTNPNFAFDFRSTMVSSISIDPHKMGLMPYSCGAFLCRKGSLDAIETKNEHAKLLDQTLIGSRSGAIAAALWAIINTLGYSGYKKILESCLANRAYFIKNLQALDPNATIIAYPGVNNFAVHFTHTKDGLLPKTIEEKYRIVPNNLPVYGDSIEYKQFYHFYTMPYINRKAIRAFINDIRPTVYVDRKFASTA